MALVVRNMPHPEKITIDGDLEVMFRTIVMSFGDGYEQRARDGLNDVVEKWKVMWAPLTLTELNTVWGTLLEVKATGILLWTPCGETVQKKFRLAETKITRSNIGNGSYKVMISVIQVFDLN